jgi:hypothetical protein
MISEGLCRECRLEPAVKPTQEDAEVLTSVQSIVELMRSEGLLPNLNARSARQLSVLIQQVLPMIPELAPGIGYTGEPSTTSFEAQSLHNSPCEEAPSADFSLHVPLAH